MRYLILICTALAIAAAGLPVIDMQDPVESNYQEYCAGCHGAKMDAFVDRKWEYGNKKKDLVASIKNGIDDLGMPAFDSTFTTKEINELATYILTGIENLERYTGETKLKPQVFETGGFRYRLDTVVSGLKVPWGLAFLPSGDYLVSDRNGKLYRVNPEGSKREISGVPKVVVKSQGGLLDLALHPDFANNQWVYISYSKKIDSSLATTAIVRARLRDDNLEDLEELFAAEPALPTRHHYGSRISFDREGYLYFSVGDRGRRDENPQSLANDCGKIHRLHDDGRVPADNPFVSTKRARPSIYSYGHRNPQGMAVHPETGKIWTDEHGPRGGDEINIIRPGANYGWPVISYGINYDGTVFTELTEKEGMEQPELYWIPSIGPSGLDFVTGNRYPDWKGHLLAGSLRFKYVNLCVLDGDEVQEQKMLLKGIGRVRNVRMGPDGFIYVSVEHPGAIYRIIPEVL